MTKLAKILALGAALAWAGAAVAQDAVTVSPRHYRVLTDNAHVRVVENVLKPGEKDATHTHAAGWFYVTRSGTMKVVRADGRTDMWEAKAGAQGWMEAEGPHSSENVGKTALSFILVEVKSAAKP
jgi:mannose-6-phosphate isomerase-like protein (cupin superfamily)